MVFEFKEDKYTFKELLELHNKNKKLYAEGEVLNVEDGYCFDISEINNERDKYFAMLVEAKDKLEQKNTSRMVWAINENHKELRIKELNKKFRKDDITLDELEELMRLERDIKPYNHMPIRLQRGDSKTFYKKYQDKRYPEELSHGDIGKFHLLLDFMTYKSEIRRTPRGNSDYPEVNELMDFMRISDMRTFNRSISKLKKYKLLKEDKEEGLRVFYVNPLYIDRNLDITPTTYKLFREDLEEFLTEKDRVYLEMKTFGNLDSGVLTVREGKKS